MDAPEGVRVAVGLDVVGLPDVVREERLLLHGRVPVVRDEEPIVRFLHLLEAPVDPLRVLGRVDGGGGGPAPSRTSRAAPSPSTRGPRGRGVACGATPPKSAAPPLAAPSRASRAPRTRSTRPVGRARPLGQPYERPPIFRHGALLRLKTGGFARGDPAAVVGRSHTTKGRSMVRLAKPKFT